MNLPDLLKITRQYFWSLDFIEVEPKYLNESLPLEPNLYSFETIWRNHGTKYYLPTSPELTLKKFLSTTPTNCFSIGHCFRDLENSGPHHSPEFLMLEYYLVNKNLNQLKLSLKKYLNELLKLKYEELVLPPTQFKLESNFNHFFLNEIEPKLPKDRAVFISGYPAFLSPLAKKNTDYVLRITDYQIAQRFELYINGIEIANACTENRNAEQIKTAFLTENKYRQDNQLYSHPMSEEFIKNCATIPPCSGIGLGLDRLLMVINQKNKI